MQNDSHWWHLLNTSQSIPSQTNPDYFSRHEQVSAWLPGVRQGRQLPAQVITACACAPALLIVLPASLPCLPAVIPALLGLLETFPRGDQIWGFVGRGRELGRWKEGVWWIQAGLNPCTLWHHTDFILDFVKISRRVFFHLAGPFFHLVGPSASKIVFRWVNYKPTLAFSVRDLVTKRSWFWS